MVKRYDIDDYDPCISEMTDGIYVLYSDYLSLQAALKEVLDDICVQHCLGDRAKELRKLLP